MLSFWSSQTIFIVNIWFLFSLIYHQKEQTNRFTNIYSQINLRTSPHMYLWRKQWNWMSSIILFKLKNNVLHI
ncbi:hypothetical protein [Spiroplasma ixodetis]|uniref:hypothetical protein n=1 Tax=Spiroplasma ixodetis TaxID=2141 RepID=UPI002490B677|nr:hypothetical protein [Spiroplasma ixodetis]